MKQNEYIRITGLIFAVIAVLHIVRLFTGWEVEIDDFEIPVWGSAVGAVIAGYLAWTSQKLKK